MTRLRGRTAIVTGAGRGLGRAHALELAARGANVVVNDLGGDVHGTGADPTPAQEVVRQIRDLGGQAVASGHDVSDWLQAAALIQLAVGTFGDLDILVNNAGIIRDRSLANMTEADWDDVIRVHLKGHAAPTRHAVAYWRERAKAGNPADASVVMTSSVSGLAGNFGQANYATAKLGVLALSRVVALEAHRYGVRSNVVSPGGRTRITDLDEPAAPEGFDQMDPANVSPLVAWLAAEKCEANGQVFHITGEHLIVSSLPAIVHELWSEGRWTLEKLDDELSTRLVAPLDVEAWLG
ncbi:SDR family NAD(P)-dependent oxidoreductase [Herbidospora sp. RD11066]